MDYFKNIKRKNAIKIVDHIFKFDDIFDSIEFRKRLFVSFLMSQYNNAQLIQVFDSIHSMCTYSEDLTEVIDELFYVYEH